MANYLGDYLKGVTVFIPFNASTADGTSATLATNGTAKAYINGGTSAITSGVTIVEDHNSITGRHGVTVDTSGSGFTVGSDVDVCLDGAVVDGVTVNVWIGKFSILRPKFDTPVVGLAQAGDVDEVTLPSSASSSNDIYNNSFVSIVYGTGAPQTREITDYVGSTRVASVEPNWGTAPDNTSVVVVSAGAPLSASATDQLVAAIVAATRNDAIQMFRDGITTDTEDGTGVMTIEDSNGDPIDIEIVRAEANPIVSTTTPTP